MAPWSAGQQVDALAAAQVGIQPDMLGTSQTQAVGP